MSDIDIKSQIEEKLSSHILTFVDFPLSHNDQPFELEENCGKLYQLGIDVVVPKYAENKIDEVCLKNVREVADDFNSQREDRRVYVGGCLELDYDFDQDNCDFDSTVEILKKLIITLIKLGADILVFKSVKNTCVAKAAIYALGELENTKEYSEIGKVPIVFSCSIDTKTTRLPCNQTFDAFVTTIRHGKPLGVGVECIDLSVTQKALRNMDNNRDVYTSCDVTLKRESTISDEDLLVLSTTNINILMITGEVYFKNLEMFLTRFNAMKIKPRQLTQDKNKDCLKLAAAEVVVLRKGKGFENLLKIGEDCDVPDVPKFRKIILAIAELNDEICETLKPIHSVTVAGKYKYGFFGIRFLLNEISKQAENDSENFNANMERIKELQKLQDEALQVASDQAALGADVLNILFDSISREEREELPLPGLWMRWFIQLIESCNRADISSRLAQTPLCIDSMKIDVILEGLKCSKGKSIANAISLANGEEQFKNDAIAIKKLGPAAVIALAITENGPAKTVEEKVETCVRMYNILKNEVGFSPSEIILDPVVPWTSSNPGPEHYGWTFIEATKRIRSELGEVIITGGISCVSQVFRGEPLLRPAMNKTFLEHCMEVGMQTAIMNVKNVAEETKKILLDNLVMNKDPDAAKKLKEFYHAQHPK